MTLTDDELLERRAREHADRIRRRGASIATILLSMDDEDDLAS